jgi:hypothetical protein
MPKHTPAAHILEEPSIRSGSVSSSYRGIHSLLGWIILAALVTSAIVLGVFLLAFSISEYTSHEGSQLYDFSTWMIGANQGVTSALSIVLTTSVSLAGAIVAIQLARNALTIAENSARQQVESARIDRHQKAIEISSILTPVVSETQAVAQDATRAILRARMRCARLHDTIIEQLRRTLQADQESLDLYLYACRSDVVQAVHSTGAVEVVTEILNDLAGALFALSGGFAVPKTAVSPIGGLPYLPLFDDLEVTRSEEISEARKRLGSAVDFHLPAPKIQQRYSDSLGVTILDLASALSLRPSQLTAHLLAEILFSAHGGFANLDRDDPEGRLNLSANASEISKQQLMFLCGILAAETLEFDEGLFLPPKDGSNPSFRSYTYLLNSGPAVFHQIISSIPDTQTVKSELTDFVREMTDKFETKTGDQDLRDYVMTFLNAYLGVHDANRIALVTTCELLKQILPDSSVTAVGKTMRNPDMRGVYLTKIEEHERG